MQNCTRILTALAVLACLTWAGSDAAFTPQTEGSQQLAFDSAADAITIPRMLSYQGLLTDTDGVAVPDDDYAVVFRFYTAPTGGAALWNETQTVTTKDGLFAVLLGSVTPIARVPDGGELYLGMDVGGGAELIPRLQIVSAAYAYKADSAAYAAVAAPVGAAGGDLSGTYPNPTVSGLRGRAVATTAPSTNQVLTWSGSQWQPATPAGDNAWSRQDSVLFTVNRLGIAKGGAGNVLYGDNASRSTHINLGVACTTGESGQNRTYATVGGGYQNTVSGNYSTVAGGYRNTASGPHTTISGGPQNRASGDQSFIGGGYLNYTGSLNSAIPGGWACTTNASGAFATNYQSKAFHNNSAAFNGQTTTADNQTRVGVLSKVSGTFTIDHPLDPHGRILNHYFIEGPEMRNIYDGETVLDASGRAIVHLPDYFDALNRNPRVQLTGVGSSDVYLAEKVSGNRFVIGGTPGIEVYWQVTGERQDVSAEVTRRIMPVEQRKTGELAGRMLDDEFLSGTMDQLIREGNAQGIDFRTAAGRQRYQRMQQGSAEAGLERGR